MSIQNVRRSILVAAALVVLAGTGIFAGRLVAHQMGGHYGAPMAPRLFAHLARQLDLSEGQRGQIREILKNHADEIESHVKSATDARRALHDAVLVQPTDEATIRQRAQELGNVHAEGALLFARIRTEVWPLLTAEQQQKVATLHSHMREHTDEALKSLDAFLRGTN
ncbi:MAG TPA: periplasmic heavy metal sensor [Thermoanaerobaculia bacterium]|jgi:Spy/CpxP family protein refolding chaperone